MRKVAPKKSTTSVIPDNKAVPTNAVDAQIDEGPEHSNWRVSPLPVVVVTKP